MTTKFDIPVGQWVNIGSGLMDIQFAGNQIKAADSAAAPDDSFTGDCFVLPAKAGRVRLNFTNAVWVTTVTKEDNGTKTTVLMDAVPESDPQPIGEGGEEVTIEAGKPFIVNAEHTPISVQIKTGTTAKVSTTCSTPEEVAAGMADWVEWTNGDKAGPFADVIRWPAVALKIESAAGGTVYLARSRA
jgi:hypothetical protein